MTAHLWASSVVPVGDNDKLRDAQPSTPDLESLDGAWDETPVGAGFAVEASASKASPQNSTLARKEAAASRKEKDRLKAEELRAK